MQTDDLIMRIERKLPGQKFSIKRTRKQWIDKDVKRFDRELAFLLKRYSMEEIVGGYVTMTQRYFEESRYFLENGKYRYSSFDEVNRMIYADETYMKGYMLGLEVILSAEPDHTD